MPFVFSQTLAPNRNFRLPLDILPVISGTFGELRSDHFHSGLDFSTQNKENVNVFCIDNGYVSRIKISATGYGKVIYVTHANGWVTVYAHLNEFNVVVEDYVRRKQYEQKTYEIELFPNPALFHVKKGDIIGYSGNTGASSGPHLHFEFRNARTELPINPFYFGTYPVDKLSPDIEKIYFYTTSAEGINKTAVDIQKVGNGFKPKTNDTLTVSGKTFFGIAASDNINNGGTCGIYALKILVDSTLVFNLHFDSLSFNDGRYINTLIDYPEYVTRGKRIIQTYVAPGNRLNNNVDALNNGLWQITDTCVHMVKFWVYDFQGNLSSVEKTVKWKPEISKQNESNKTVLPLFRYGLKNHFEAENITVDLPPDALYDSIYFDCQTLAASKQTYSKIFKIHNNLTPIHSFATLKIKPDTTLPLAMREKLTLAEVSGKNFVYTRSEWAGEYLSAKIRRFGNYAIVADTIAPEIAYLGMGGSKKIDTDGQIKFKITDDFSGIATYQLTINGQWVLAAYDAKSDMLIYKTDPLQFKKGSNDIEVRVTDKLNNQRIFRTTINY